MEKELPRLQKALAAAGVASRRACEALIAEGRVQVNGTVVREMGTKVDPQIDDIRVDGQPLIVPQRQKPLYIMLNKPVGFTSTVSDPHADHTVLELLTQIEERVYPVGRLDVDSDGLLLLTNDGEFANRLTHPRYHVPKLYRVRAKGFIGRDAATRLAEGVDLPEGITAPAEVRFIEYDAATQCTIIEMTLYEGRNRQVRRMLDAVGNPVRQLTRIGFGSLRLHNLNPGTWRKLRHEEVTALLALAQPTPTPPKTARRPQSSVPFRPRNAGNREQETGNPTEEAHDVREKAKESETKQEPILTRPSTIGNPHFRPNSNRGAERHNSPMPPYSPQRKPDYQRKPGNVPYSPQQKSDQPPYSPARKPDNSPERKSAPNRKFVPQNRPTPAPDGSTNNAAGRKAGIPYQAQPKTGHSKFGRAKP